MNDCDMIVINVTCDIPSNSLLKSIRGLCMKDLVMFVKFVKLETLVPKF